MPGDRIYMNGYSSSHGPTNLALRKSLFFSKWIMALKRRLSAFFMPCGHGEAC